jgi:uncharacterized membrane protein HdeD (DUF308 family)
MGALVMLIIQFALGTGVNLYITPHKGGVGEAFSNGALLAVHAVLGVLLILAALQFLVRSIMARHRLAIVTSAIGLIAIIAAAGSGVGYLSNRDAGSSLGMALATAVAMLCYAVAIMALVPSERAKA